LKEAHLHFDVVIIGASSAGLFAAEQLAREGIRVGVFERQETLDPARRTYILTPHIDKVMDGVPEALVLHRVTTMAVETVNASVEIPLRQPDLVMERNEIIRYLAERAREAGVALFMGHSFDGVDDRAVKINADSQQELIQTDTIIGADGAFSRVAAFAGLEPPPTVPLAQAEIELDDDWDPTITKVWFDVDETRFFYWLIPESEKRAVVGLIGEEDSDVRAILDRFMHAHGFEPETYQVGQAAMHRPVARPWGCVGELPVYLIGDAAGQVKVTTVGGTVTGFWGARAVVDAILNDKPYAQALRPLKRELDMHWLIRLFLERLGNQGYDRMVELINPSVVAFLAKRNRDEMAGAFWKLLLLQPRFALFATRLLTPAK
jgi:flavin-dependent dehydrogenase